MRWFKKRVVPEPFDIGEPYYNLDLIISELRSYDSFDSFMAIKNDLLIDLNGKHYSFNHALAYSVLENILPKELSISKKGYFINQQFNDLPTRQARLTFTEPSNIDALIDWNKLFKFVTKPMISDDDLLISQAVKHLDYLMSGSFEGWTVHAHYLSNGDLITFEVDIEQDNKIRVQETYEAQLSFEEYNKRFMERMKIQGRIAKKNFKL